MPSKPKSLDPAAAAIAEVLAEEASEDDPKAVATIDFHDHVYTFRRARLNSVEFLTLMQRGAYLAAMEWLLGPGQWRQLTQRNSGPDGMNLAVMDEFIAAMNAVDGPGNS